MLRGWIRPGNIPLFLMLLVQRLILRHQFQIVFDIVLLVNFLGSTKILINASLSKSFKVAIIGSLPINSGINPNFNKS